MSASMSFPLMVHIAAGTVGLLSGLTGVFLLKGSRRHAIAGNIFVVAMLLLGVTGTYMAVLKFQPGNIIGGVMTIYLVATAWLAGRRREMGTNAFDWAAFLVVLAAGVTEITLAVEAVRSPTGEVYGFSPGPFVMFGIVATIAAIGDVRMLARGGVTGTQRIARHLWRMCFALFIASGSVFMARAQLFPAFMRNTGMLYALTLLPLVLMVFWLIRVRFARRFKAMFSRPAAGAPSGAMPARG